MGKVITPPEWDFEIGFPLIFLAGPIQGAKDWHSEAIGYITALDESVNIASPSGPDEYYQNNFGEEEYRNQVHWETHYLNKASELGVILFWLAKEHEHNCKRAYAQTTRFELGEWKAKHEKDARINIVIGIEQGFSNERYIRRRIGEDCPELTIYDDLYITCRKAILKLYE